MRNEKEDIQIIETPYKVATVALISSPKLVGAEGSPPVIIAILPEVSLMRTEAKALRPTISRTAASVALSPAAYLAASICLSWL